MNMKAMQVFVIPAKAGLPNIMQVRERGSAMYSQLASDHRV